MDQRILAIETSCDETACALVEKRSHEEGVYVLAEETATSLHKHQVTVGIVPEVAAREHVKVIIPVIESCLKQAGYDPSTMHHTIPITALAVTNQPGLIGSLLVGVETARTLSLAWNVPIIPVNHVAAHPYACFALPKPLAKEGFAIKKSPLERGAIPQSGIGGVCKSLHTKHSQSTTHNVQLPKFPLLSWVISGGHTQLYYATDHDHWHLLGQTRDDAAGECLDKCARVLGFGYPGGPAIEKAAKKPPSNKRGPA